MPKHLPKPAQGRARHHPKGQGVGSRKPDQTHGLSTATAGHHGQARLGRGSAEQQPEKKPSVFDRLGSKRVNPTECGNFSNDKGLVMSKVKPIKSRGGPGSLSKNETSSNRHASSSGIRRDRDEQEKESGDPRNENRSTTPRHKRKSLATPSTASRRDDQNSSSSKHLRRSDKPQGKPLNSKKHERPTTTKSRPRQEISGKTNKPKESHKSKSSKFHQKASTAPKRKERRRSKSSHGTSSQTSSTTPSHSSSSTGTSSSSSTSDSSAPSIKLKPEKKDRGLRPSSKTKTVVVKEKSKKETVVNKLKNLPDSSSGSGASIYLVKQGESRASPNSRTGLSHRKDFPEKMGLKSDKPKALERLMGDFRKSRDRDHPERPRSNSRLRTEDPAGRKRRISGESYCSVGKRSRLDSPLLERKHNAPVKRTSPSTKGPSPLSRDRNRPLSKERVRMLPRSPKRPAYEEQNTRNEPRNIDRDSSSRFANSPRPKEGERDRQYAGGSNNSPNFVSRERDDKRPRERLAPARTPTPLGRERRQPPSMERREPPPHDFEPIRRAPLLSYAQGPEQGRVPFQQQRRPPFEESRGRNPPLAPTRRRSPMIVKTKEALIEKYEDLTKKSRVDLWVDETLRGNRGTDGIAPLIPKALLPDSRRGSTPLQDTKIRRSPSSHTSTGRKNYSRANNTVTPIKTAKEDPPGESLALDEVLSEISEDDDEILTKDVEKVESSEIDITTTTASDKLGTKTEDGLSEKDSDVANAKVTSSDNTIGEEAAELKSVKSEQTLMPPPVETTLTRDKEIQSHTQSHSQTDDDILDRMDFEEISDEELEHVESNRIRIVDALGIDWSSLVCRDKGKQSAEADDVPTSSLDRLKTKERWTPASIFKEIGLPKALLGESLFQKIVTQVEEMETRCGIFPKTTVDEIQNPLLRRRRLERKSCLEKYGLGTASRALSARRDLALRRYLLNLPSKPLVSLELGQ